MEINIESYFSKNKNYTQTKLLWVKYNNVYRKMYKTIFVKFCIKLMTNITSLVVSLVFQTIPFLIPRFLSECVQTLLQHYQALLLQQAPQLALMSSSRPCVPINFKEMPLVTTCSSYNILQYMNTNFMQFYVRIFVSLSVSLSI